MGGAVLLPGSKVLPSVLAFSVITLTDYLTCHCILISRYFLFLPVEGDGLNSGKFLNVWQ
jgi:hypothetical protein